MNKFITLLIILFTTNLFSQNKEHTDTSFVQLQEVSISADYTANEKTPFSFSNVRIDVLEEKNTGQEASFILSETPSITAYSDAGNLQGYSYFRIRGVDQTRINMTLDGVPLNEPEEQGVYFSNYPDFFNSVSKIQIQRGVGTSKNGTASYGGGLQFTSPNLFDTTRATFSTGYGSYNTYRLFGEFNSGVKNKKGIYVRASHLHSDGYKEHSANTSGSVFISGALFFDKSSLKITSFTGSQKNQLAWLGVSEQKINDSPKTNGNTNENDHFLQSLTQLQLSNYLNDKLTIRSSIFFNYLDGYYDFDLNNYLGYPSTEELYRYNFKSYFTGLFSNITYFISNLKWTSGINTNMYSRNHIGSEKTIGNLYENTGYRNEFSAFSKIEYNFRNFLLYADIQYRYTDFDYKGDVSFNKMQWNFINPKIGLTYQLSKETFVYYSIGKTGREPTRNDIFGGWDNLQADSLNNPALSITQAEYVLDNELGVRYENKKLNFKLNAYYMDFKNEIVLKGQFGPNGLPLNDKVDNSFRSGIELDIAYYVNKQLKLVNNSSYNYSQITQKDISFVPILTPSFIVNQDVIFYYKNLETGISFRYQSTSFIDFANDNKINDYILLNYRISYLFKHLKIAFFINNLTNERYYSNGYVDFDGTNKYFIQAPVNLYGMLSYYF